MTIALSVIIISAVIALGKILGKCKIFGISLGVTWILFVGIVFAHFGYTLDHALLHFLKEFGLILFVYSMGLQVGPGFFSSFRAGGIKLNVLATMLVLCGVAVTYLLIVLTGTEAPTMVGVMSGAVTNTPGLGAAQTAYVDVMGESNPTIALGYAVAYPLGVVGCILTFIVLKMFYRGSKSLNVTPLPDTDSAAEEAAAATVVGGLNTKENLSNKKIIVSKRKLNGISLGKLEFDKYLGVQVVKIRRAGIEINPKQDTILQLGDVVTVIGSKAGIADAEKVLGNSMKKLDEPNLIAFFAGIALGCALGSIPIAFPGIPSPVKLGLAGGPLIVAILMGYFGPKFKIVTYTTTSANLMIREIGIALFLACVGLEAGSSFVDTILHKGGLAWIGYGALITIVPVFLCGLFGKLVFKLNYSTLIGVLSGASTNPPALAFAQEQDKSNDDAAIGYATVYPLSMFLRVLCAQLLMLMML